MPAIPTSLINGLQIMLEPYLGHRPEAAALQAALERLKAKPQPLSTYAAAAGLTVSALKSRLNRSGVRPKAYGGKSGHEGLYAADEVDAALN